MDNSERTKEPDLNEFPEAIEPDESSEIHGSDQLEEEEEEKNLLLIGRVRDVLIGMMVDQIKGVDRVSNVTPLPGAVQYISGLVYFRGGIEVAVDIGIILGGDTIHFSPKSRAVLAEAEGMRGAVLFDELVDMHSIAENEILPLDVYDIPKDPVVGQFNWRGEAGLLISPAGLFRYVSQPEINQ